MTLSRFPAVSTRNIRDSDGPRPSYQMATANPPDDAANPVVWERPMLYTQIDIGPGLTLHLVNLHLKSKLASNIPGRKIDSFTWRSGWYISSTGTKRTTSKHMPTTSSR